MIMRDCTYTVSDSFSANDFSCSSVWTNAGKTEQEQLSWTANAGEN